MNNSSLIVGTASPPTVSTRPVAPKLPSTGAVKPATVVPDRQKLSTATNPSPAIAPDTPTADDLKKLLDQMQTKVSGLSEDLQFSIDHDSGKTLLTMTDRTTKEVIWQVPSEVAMRISKSLDQFQKGTLLSSQA